MRDEQASEPRRRSVRLRRPSIVAQAPASAAPKRRRDASKTRLDSHDGPAAAPRRQAGRHVDLHAPADERSVGQAGDQGGFCDDFTRSVARGTDHGSFDEMPWHLQANEFIRGAYRINRAAPGGGLSAAQCLASVLHVHNESGNIWSHLVPWLLFAGYAIYYASDIFVEGHLSFVSFAIGSQICFMLSTVYHTFNSHSQQAWSTLLNLDYLGIGIAFLGVSMSSVYPVLYCFDDLRRIYLAGMVLMGAVTIGVFMSPLNAESNPWAIVIRGVTMICGAGASVLPTLHLYVRTGSWFWHEKYFYWCKFPFLVVMVLCTAISYTFKLPERLAPGRFDVWGHSHQLMHIAVAVCSLLMFSQNVDYMAWRREHQCRIP